MPRRPGPSAAQLTSLWRLFGRLPLRLRVGLVALGLLGLGLYYVFTQAAYRAGPAVPPPTGLNADGSGEFLFCFWNVENLFDDQDDKRREVDEPFDDAFAADDALRQNKLDRLARILLALNGGKGPDVLACAEVESPRAADLLKATLNRHLDEAKADPKLKYTQVAMKNLDAGRHIAPALITRLNVNHAATRMHGTQLRVLEARLLVNGYELVVVASHWTSQLRQRDGTDGDAGREKYAKLIAKVHADLAAKNPAADLLVCGDFNDTPAAVAEFLNATDDPQALRQNPRAPKLLNLMQGRPADAFGTLFYGGKPLIYDQVCVSPGMLDGQGWGVKPDSVRTAIEGLTRPGATRREPWRFGDPGKPPAGGRGYSDHFPVTVTLDLAAPAGKPVKPE